MKKIIAILLLFSTVGVFSIEKEKEKEPTPYEKNEFHPILHDVRRASVIFCGAFPLGYMYSSIVGTPIISELDMYSDLDYTDKNNKEIELKLMSSLVFAGVVMLIDFVIEKFFVR